MSKQSSKFRFIAPQGRKVLRRSPLVLKREFSRSISVKIEPNNPLELDNSQEIADTFHKNEAGLNNYFETKRNAILDSYREDSNSAAASGIEASELQEWMQRRDELLEQLDDQVDTVFDLASVYGDSSSSDSGSHAGPSTDAPATDSSTDAPATGSSTDAAQTAMPGRFVQDSSDVTSEGDMPPFDDE